jgi:hypothetical protein
MHLIKQIGRARLYLDSLFWADEPDEVEIAAVTCRLHLYHLALKNVWICLGADLEAEGADLDPTDLLWAITLTNEPNTFNNSPFDIKPTLISVNRNSAQKSVFYKISSAISTTSLPI